MTGGPFRLLCEMTPEEAAAECEANAAANRAKLTRAEPWAHPMLERWIQEDEQRAAALRGGAT